MRASLAGLASVALSLALVASVSAATNPGAACAKSGAVAGKAARQVVCTMRNGKLVWVARTAAKPGSNASSAAKPGFMESLPLPASAAIGIVGAESGGGGRSFVPFGYESGPRGESAVGTGTRNPQPVFYAPLGTPVLAPVSGLVSKVTKLYSGDYSVMINVDHAKDFFWETEHVLNPTVKAGDQVKAGQPIATISDYDARYTPGVGLVEIGLLQGGNPPSHVCPFAYVAASKQTQIAAQLDAILASNIARGLSYAAMQPVGCIGSSPVAG